MTTNDPLVAIHKLQRQVLIGGFFSTLVLLLAISANYVRDEHARRTFHAKLDTLNTRDEMNAQGEFLRKEIQQNRLESRMEHARFDSIIMRSGR